jgi:hypothetical protein
MHPAVHGNRLQSLAEATVAPARARSCTAMRVTEELYHVTPAAA